MATTMHVVSMAPNEFGVELTEGYERTGHKVRLPQSFLDEVFPDAVDPDDGEVPAEFAERLVRETFEFLLEREPATSILREFSLDDVSRYFPEYPEEIRRRLT